jgi:benzoyl-CoA 2,3-dioxygenase component B
MFTDRDGKFQLAALAESGFDPLARSCRFMLTEEAHHLFVGETGIDRIVSRSAELTRRSPNGLASELGGIDLDVVQRNINYWFAFCLDLFGSEISTNAAESYAAGLKGRFREEKRFHHHDLRDDYFVVPVVEGGRLVDQEVPMRNALNEVLRGDYRHDCERVVDKWNETIASHGVDFKLSLPSTRFFRRQGLYRDSFFNPAGEPIDEDTWNRNRDQWLPTEADREAVMRVMGPVTEPGVFANWIAPPKKGLGGKGVEFAYVRFD